jgi:hypothetical protein
MLRTFFIAAALLVTVNVSSQQFQGGITAGLNASRIDGDGHDMYGKLGLNAGVFVARAIIPDLLYWQLELKYTSRGKYHIERDNQGYISGLELIDLRYAELPLSVHYFFNPRIQLELGLAPDVLLKEYYEDENGEIPNEHANDLHRFGVTVFGSVNYFFIESLAAGIRFNYSALPFYRTSAYAVRFRDSGWFHDVLSINMRYYFVR